MAGFGFHPSLAVSNVHAKRVSRLFAGFAKHTWPASPNLSALLLKLIEGLERDVASTAVTQNSTTNVKTATEILRIVVIVFMVYFFLSSEFTAANLQPLVAVSILLLTCSLFGQRITRHADISHYIEPALLSVQTSTFRRCLDQKVTRQNHPENLLALHLSATNQPPPISLNGNVIIPHSPMPRRS